MNLRQLFTINLFIAVFFGVSCAVVPAWVIQLYGLEPDEGAIWTTRLVGGSILGFATLMWYGRGAAPAGARRAIAIALLVQDAVGTVASLELQLSGAVNVLGWSSVVLYGLLALGYAWFVFVRPADI